MPQKYFAALDENGIVVNYTTVDYPHSIIEYSADKSITKNQPMIGSSYNPELKAFIPPKPEETYILNFTTYNWEPDPNLEYIIDNTTCRWSSKQQMWVLIENWSAEYE